MRGLNQRGEGRIGLLIALIVVGAAIFVGAKVIPVRINAYEFRDVLRQECRMGAVRTDDAAMKRRILQQAKALEIPLKKKNLRIRRTASEMIVSATYEQPINLKVTTYVYKFSAQERAPVF